MQLCWRGRRQSLDLWLHLENAWTRWTGSPDVWWSVWSKEQTEDPDVGSSPDLQLGGKPVSVQLGAELLDLQDVRTLSWWYWDTSGEEDGSGRTAAKVLYWVNWEPQSGLVWSCSLWAVNEEQHPRLLSQVKRSSGSEAEEEQEVEASTTTTTSTCSRFNPNLLSERLFLVLMRPDPGRCVVSAQDDNQQGGGHFTTRCQLLQTKWLPAERTDVGQRRRAAAETSRFSLPGAASTLLQL